MTVDRLRPVADAMLRPFVTIADRVGATPNIISLLAFGCAIGAAFAFFQASELTTWYLIGALLVFANGWLDLLDGALARRQSVASERGDLLDHVLDRYADVVIVGGLAASIDAYLLGFAAVTGVLLTSYLGTQSIAVGLDRVYGGFVGRADRLLLIGVMATMMVVVPEPMAGLTLVGWLLVFLAVVGHLTAVQRFAYAWNNL